MRAFLSVLVASVFAVGCSQILPTGSVSEADRASWLKDDRHVLVSYEMPVMSFDDVKACYQLARISADEVTKMPGVVGQVMGPRFIPFWGYFVNEGTVASAKDTSLLEDGIFQESDSKPTIVLENNIVKRSEQCGFVVGQSLMGSGYLNIGDVVELEATDDNVEFDSQQSLGMYIMGEAAKAISSQEPKMVVDCVSVIRASIPVGEELTSDYFVWLSVMSDKISANDLDSSSLAEISSEFKNLVDNKKNLSLAANNFEEELKDQCVKISSAEVTRISAEVSDG